VAHCADLAQSLQAFKVVVGVDEDERQVFPDTLGPPATSAMVADKFTVIVDLPMPPF
jgi:hypothetical protein